LSYEITRATENGLRFYRVTEGDKEIAKLPSVTTILGNTKDKSGLDKWRKKVGEEEADRISNLSMNRGTVMHRLIELYKPIKGTKTERLNKLKELAANDEEVNQFNEDSDIFLNEGWKFFMKFYLNSSNFFDRVDEVMMAEEFLWTVKQGGWAGTVDNISKMVDGKVLIIDYKNSRKPKRDEWIQDYYMQAAAYWVAYWDRYDIKATGAEIWIANEIDSTPQCFSLTETDLTFYFQAFVKRREMFKEKFNI
jgi:genome maintenance exonuclease 1